MQIGNQQLSYVFQAMMVCMAAGAQQKLEEDGQQLTGCTFAPKTGRAPKGEGAPKQPFPDRLYRHRDGKYAQVLVLLIVLCRLVYHQI